VEPYAEISAQYADFAVHAAEESPCLEAWCHGVLGDPEVISWIGTLPRLKQQPNIVFASARWHGVPAPGPYAGLRDALLGDDGAIRDTILTRATQTNEVGRLATLLPAFSRLADGRPLALVEAGASAGLCLYPDRWGYAWQTENGPVTVGEPPRLTCEVRGPVLLPASLPVVAGRFGIDLNPLDVADEESMAWLATLVWPEDDERRVRLAQAVEVAKTDPPRLVRGDLLDGLPALVAEASAYGEVVVFHSAVIVYLEEPDRRRFEALVAGLVADGACHWVSNEAANVLPDVSANAGVPPPSTGFVLGIDGQAVAWTHGHGRRLRWL
jgi:hypothetical protein